MSRFDRRLSTGGGGSSPRPGTATCKIRPRNRHMLSGFIQVTEKSNNSDKKGDVVENNEKNTLIQEVSTKTYNQETEKAFENVMRVNEQLRIAISNTTNQNMRQLLIHELRLNTLEVNLDCLTDLKCEEVSKEQEKVEENYNLATVSEKVSTFDDSIKQIKEQNNDIVVKLNEQKQIIDTFKKENLDSINYVKDEMNNICQKNEDLESEINNLKDTISSNNNEKLIEENESLKIKVDLLEERLQMIIEKMLEKDNDKYMDLANVLN